MLTIEKVLERIKEIKSALNHFNSANPKIDVLENLEIWINVHDTAFAIGAEVWVIKFNEDSTHKPIIEIKKGCITRIDDDSMPYKVVYIRGQGEYDYFRKEFLFTTQKEAIDALIKMKNEAINKAIIEDI